MKRFIGLGLLLIALLCLFLIACEAETVEVTRVVAEEKVVAEPLEIVEADEELNVAQEVVTKVQVEQTDETYDPAGAADLDIATGNRLQQQRLIIKSAEINIAMKNSAVAVDNVVQVAVDYGGYIVSQLVWQHEGYTYATITLGVPVNEFENAMRRLRNMADNVLNESASGTDVSDEYVDLNSRLTNLQVTRDRIRTFLDQADTVEESLQVNEELAAIEGQMAEIQGRINYLSGRSAFSTITVQIDPILPTPTPAPTPMPTSTPTPSPTPGPWRPGKTVGRATERLSRDMTALAEFTIYNGIVCGPYLVVLLVGAWVVFKIRSRFLNQEHN